MNWNDFDYEDWNNFDHEDWMLFRYFRVVGGVIRSRAVQVWSPVSRTVASLRGRA